MVEEPWASRLLAADRAGLLVDFRQPAEVERVLGGPFYEVVSVASARPPRRKRRPPRKPRRPARSSRRPASEPPPEAALVAYARAVARVQAWLAGTPPETVAERLPAALVGDRARFVARLAALQAAYAGTGEATREGLEATIRVLCGAAAAPGRSPSRWARTTSRRPPRSPRLGASSARHRRHPERTTAPASDRGRREPERPEETGRRPERQAHDVRVAAVDPADEAPARGPAPRRPRPCRRARPWRRRRRSRASV